MSVQATSWVWEQADLAGSSLLVLLAIADAASREGENSCQAVSTLARMARVSESTVHRVLRTLREEGWIEQTGVSGRYKTNVYRLPKMGLTPVTHDTSQNATPVIQDARPLSPMTPEPTTTPSLPTTEQSVERTSRGREVPPEKHDRCVMSTEWAPRPAFAQMLMVKYPGIDLRERCARFVAHQISKGGASRSWEAALRLWISQDWERWSEQQGTDDLGIPKGQRTRTTRPLQPGDDGYVDPDELAAAARQTNTRHV